MCNYKNFVEDYNNLNMTTHEVRRIHGLNSREYMEVRSLALENGDISNNRHANKRNAKFYTVRSDGTVDVQKQFNGKKVYFGRFKNEEDAKMIVRKLINNNWVVNKEIRNLIDECKCKPKNYSIVNGYYVIQKSLNGRNEVYATLSMEDYSENDIISLVKKFRNCRWDKKEISRILGV